MNLFLYKVIYLKIYIFLNSLEIFVLGQLENIISSSIYVSPCFIQIEFGQCGLKPLVCIILEKNNLILINYFIFDRI